MQNNRFWCEVEGLPFRLAVDYSPRRCLMERQKYCEYHLGKNLVLNLGHRSMQVDAEQDKLLSRGIRVFLAEIQGYNRISSELGSKYSTKSGRFSHENLSFRG